jgi:hypothetical protein
MSDAAIEREVQRRLAEILASAGVDQGRVSLEVLYMLPPEFVRTYTYLFDKALREAIQTPQGTPNPSLKKPSKSLRPNKTLGGPNHRGAAGGQKKYREHWVIRDEDALKLKASTDRKLRRVAQEIRGALGSERPEILCSRCNTNLQAYLDVSQGGLRFCPSCGSDLREKRKDKPRPAT